MEGSESLQQPTTSRSNSLRSEKSSELQSIAEDETQGAKHKQSGGSGRRAHMVKKALRYFEDKSNRSVSEDNLFTRRKNLAVHLGLDEKVSKREVQKIATFCLPVPSSAAEAGAAPPEVILVVEEKASESEEEVRTKDLVSFLGMKDGLTASIASQGTLAEDADKPGSAEDADKPGSAEDTNCVKVAALMSCARIDKGAKAHSVDPANLDKPKLID